MEKGNRIFNLLTLILVLTISVPFVSAQNYEERLQGLDEIVERAMKEFRVPGVGIGIVVKDKVLSAKGYGYRDVEKELPVTENTIFAIGSSSKAFTAAVVCILAEDDIVDLDEPVRTYLPDFKMKDEYATDHITLRNMLSHNSGLPRHDFVWYGSSKTREELLDAIQYLEPTMELREGWQYQNLMYMTAGYISGKMTGSSWEEQVQEKIFDPLGMTSSNFSVEISQQQDDFSMPYNIKNETINKIDFANIDQIGPAGSINSNVKDMVKWLQFQVNKGTYEGDELMNENSFEEMHKPQTIVPGNMERDEVFYNLYGLGWFITSYRGHLRVEHGGNIDGFSAMVGLLPRDSIGVVILTNMNGTRLTSALRNTIFDMMLEKNDTDWIEEMKPATDTSESDESEQEDVIRRKNTEPSHELSEFAGKYRHPAYGDFEIRYEDGKLKGTYGKFDSELEHYHYNIFKVIIEEMPGDWKVTFHYDQNGEINMLTTIIQAGVDPIEFEKVYEFELTEDMIDKYTGEYDLKGMTLKVWSKDNDTMMFTVPGQPDYTLEPKNKTTFNLSGFEGYSVRFITDESGEVESLILIQPNGNFEAEKK